jgi:hypothetical protein
MVACLHDKDFTSPLPMAPATPLPLAAVARRAGGVEVGPDMPKEKKEGVEVGPDEKSPGEAQEDVEVGKPKD